MFFRSARSDGRLLVGSSDLIYCLEPMVREAMKRIQSNLTDVPAGAGKLADRKILNEKDCLDFAKDMIDGLTKLSITEHFRVFAVDPNLQPHVAVAVAFQNPNFEEDRGY